MNKPNNQSSTFCWGWRREDDVTIEIPGPGAHTVSSVRKNQAMEKDGRCVEKLRGRYWLTFIHTFSQLYLLTRSQIVPSMKPIDKMFNKSLLKEWRLEKGSVGVVMAVPCVLYSRGEVMGQWFLTWVACWNHMECLGNTDEWVPDLQIMIKWPSA